jgi:xanthosine utilization system XapX-like protein
MKPGTRVRNWASRWCSKPAMDRLIDPMIADLQHEHAASTSGSWERCWILAKGYAAFLKVLVICLAVETTGTLHARASETAVRRGLASACVAMFLLSGLLATPPFVQSLNRDNQIVWPLLLLLPQALPLSLPVSLLVGVVYGLRGRTPTPMIRRTVLVVGVVGSLASFATINWLVPAANQAFRVTIAKSVVVHGMNDVSSTSIREQALADRNDGRLDRAGVLFFAFHARRALIGAALAFALFGLGITALRTSPAACAAICLVGSAVYVGYFFELRNVSPSLFSDERVAVLLAWFPNAVMIITSAAFLSVREHTNLHEAT